MDQRSHDTEMFADAGTERCLALAEGPIPAPRPERHLHVRVPALAMTRPGLLRGYLLTNSFVSQVGCDLQATGCKSWA